MEVMEVGREGLEVFQLLPCIRSPLCSTAQRSEDSFPTEPGGRNFAQDSRDSDKILGRMGGRLEIVGRLEVMGRLDVIGCDLDGQELWINE